MHTSSRVTALFGAILLCACEKPEPAAPTTAEPAAEPQAPVSQPEPQPAAPAQDHRHPEEVHFSNVVQLTAGGENAEAYWSFDGTKLIYQAHEGDGCDQIYTRPARDPKGVPQLVSTGKGATTCAYY